MNESPQHQNKHRHQGSCQPFPQQVQAHFGLSLRVIAVAVIPATVPGTVVLLRYIILCSEGFYSPDSGVALHFLSQRYISCKRRSQASLFSLPLALLGWRIALRDKLEWEGGRRRRLRNGKQWRNHKHPRKGTRRNKPAEYLVVISRMCWHYLGKYMIRLEVCKYSFNVLAGQQKTKKKGKENAIRNMSNCSFNMNWMNSLFKVRRPNPIQLNESDSTYICIWFTSRVSVCLLSKKKVAVVWWKM